MGKISSYPRITTPKANDTAILDGSDGTRIINLSDLSIGLDNMRSWVIHRNTYRGKNLGGVFTDQQKAAIANQTFDDLFIGDYWLMEGLAWRIVDINYWLRAGESDFDKPHVVVMPDTVLYHSRMNEERNTNGGYINSEMYVSGLNNAKSMIYNLFGESYVLEHDEILSNAVSNGRVSGAIWAKSKVELPNEIMMFGSYIFTPCGDGGSVSKNYTVGREQLALMRLYPLYINAARASTWLRDVVSDLYFACIYSSCIPAYEQPTINYGVRPVFGLVGTPN